MRRTCRGVNAACTTLRIMVCRGASIARNDCEASSSSSGTFSNSTPLPGQERLAVAADGDDVGVPGHGPVAGSSGSCISASSTGGCQLTGRSARSSANDLSRSAAVVDQNARDDRSIGSYGRGEVDVSGDTVMPATISLDTMSSQDVR